jgi:hypothetical protein
MTFTTINRLSQQVFAKAFTYIFFFLSASIIVATLVAAVQEILLGTKCIQVLIGMINSSIITIAVYETAMVISNEYGKQMEHDVFVMLRNTLPRFIGTVCIALSLGGLIMIIKYSQLKLAGNLYYPVATIMSAAMLLIALGVF